MDMNRMQRLVDDVAHRCDLESLKKAFATTNVVGPFPLIYRDIEWQERLRRSHTRCQLQRLQVGQQQDLAQEYLDSLGVSDDSTGLEGLDIEGFTNLWLGLGGSRLWMTSAHGQDPRTVIC